MGALQPISAMPVPLFAVVATAELGLRPSRAPDFAAENRALGDLVQAFATSPQSVLQTLADVALSLCNAHSAGVSVLEDHNGVPVFRWRALSGQLAPQAGRTMPRAFSPCGTVVDRDALHLWSRPGRHFPCMDILTPVVEEALVIPFRVNNQPHGTIWAVAHDNGRRFDAEDARLLASLGRFATAVCETAASIRDLETRLAESEAIAALLETADRRKDRFIAILGHELRSRLAPTKNAAEMLKHETLDFATRRYVSGIIERQVSGMSQLVDDLLGVARLRGGSLELRRTSASLAEILERTIEIVRPIVAARGHALEVELPLEPLRLEADVIWLSQALQNLVVNAAKYTAPGGRIGVNVRRDGREAVITVTDSGMGIAPAKLDAIFDLYVQLGPNGSDTSAGGLGIGLYLVRLLIEGHGGSVRAVSAGPGCGSEFIVRVPCDPPFG